jgi:hypothetical protein
LLPVQALMLLHYVWYWLKTSKEQRQSDTEAKQRAEFEKYLQTIGMTEEEYNDYAAREMAARRAQYERRLKKYQRLVKKIK